MQVWQEGLSMLGQEDKVTISVIKQAAVNGNRASYVSLVGLYFAPQTIAENTNAHGKVPRHEN